MKNKKLLLLILLLVSAIFLLIVLFFEHDKNKKVFVQDFESVRVGKIEKVASSFVYTCSGCGYKFSFPDTWGFIEEGNDMKLTTDKVEFKITTLGRGEEFGELREGGREIPYSSMNVSGSMRKTIVGNLRESAIELENNGRKYEIVCIYKEEKDLDSDLPAFLVNFQFI